MLGVPSTGEGAMHLQSPLRSQIPIFRKAAQELRLWVLAVLAWWAAAFGGRGARIELRRALRTARAEARDLVFLAAMARIAVRRPAPQTMRPPSAARGFRYRFRRFRPVRIVTRAVVLDTLADIRAALDAFDATVTRALARLPRRWIAGAVVAVAPPALCVAHACGRLATEAADTS
jgi:hypothetical protein